MKTIRDLLYESIEVDDFALRFVKSELFQRLRGIKQLSSVWFVWPWATGSRFAHSLGTYHVTKIWLAHLSAGLAQPLPARTQALVSVGALLHDCGHVCFSHLAEQALEKPLGLSSHEQRSQDLARHIARTENIDIGDEELDLVCAVISGSLLPGYPPFLFELVHNVETELDADKFNYLAFDAHHLGFSTNIELSRIIKFSSVRGGHVCFHRRAYWLLHDVFMKRYREHRDALRHHAVISADRLVCEIIKLLSAVFDFREMFSDFRWTLLNDGILEQVPLLLAMPHWDPARRAALQRAEEIRVQLYRREWPKILVVDTPAAGSPAGTDTVRLGLSASDFHPLSRIRFFDQDDAADEVRFFSPGEISSFLPLAHFEELEIRRRPDPAK